METEKTNFAVLFEATAFLRHFAEMPDHRQQGKVAYPLNEILLSCLLAVIAGAETFTEIARFGQAKIKLLRRFLPFENGTPAHDHLGVVIEIAARLASFCYNRGASTRGQNVHHNHGGHAGVARHSFPRRAHPR